MLSIVMRRRHQREMVNQDARRSVCHRESLSPPQRKVTPSKSVPNLDFQGIERVLLNPGYASRRPDKLSPRSAEKRPTRRQSADVRCDQISPSDMREIEAYYQNLLRKQGVLALEHSTGHRKASVERWKSDVADWGKRQGFEGKYCHHRRKSQDPHRRSQDFGISEADLRKDNRKSVDFDLGCSSKKEKQEHKESQEEIKERRRSESFSTKSRKPEESEKRKKHKDTKEKSKERRDSKPERLSRESVSDEKGIDVTKKEKRHDRSPRESKEKSRSRESVGEGSKRGERSSSRKHKWL